MVHIVLVILMLAGIAMIGQQLSMNIYQIGLIVLTAATFVQIAFGNIPGSYTFRRAMKLFWPFMADHSVIFVMSFILVPIMYAIGR